MSRIGYPNKIEVVDSHTEGEPTRVVVSGWPEPRGLTMQEFRDDLAENFDHLRRAIIDEPRGHDAIVGALLTRPVTEGADVGVIFFNNVGYLGMCGHGTIGVVETLAWLGRVEPGAIRLDTPAGLVDVFLDPNGAITIRNVPATCYLLDQRIDVPGLGEINGDIAYGGNWFFITSIPAPALELKNVDELLEVTRKIRATLIERDVTGAGGAEIDHIELMGPSPELGEAGARNFVLCPGGAYDRSPCGTGTSAKLAALYKRGEIELEERWIQESIVGGRFIGWLTKEGADLIPWIRGRAFITGETTLYFSVDDPFRGGLSSDTRELLYN